MRDHNVLSGPLLEEVGRILGPALEPTAAASLAHSTEDHLFVWNDKDQSILAINLSTRGENRIQTLNLADCPQHNVTGLFASSRARWITVFGEDGVTAVEVPRRSGAEGRFGGGDSELLCRSIHVYRERDGGKVQKASWHPGSQAEAHLLVLTTDGSLSLHYIGDQSSRVVQRVSLGGSRVATALGEVAVDFCFGSPVEFDDQRVWPIYVLWADGEVFYVNADLSSDWVVEGPVEVLPEQEENYSQEACSILAVGGKTGSSVLVVARVGGTILHHVMLGDPGSGRLSLHLYEKVELDLGPLNACDSVFSCPVRIVSDSSSQARYLVMHDSGLHQVELPMSASEDVEEAEAPCTVEHLICTRPTLDSPAAPLLGTTVAYPPATIISLLANNTLHAMKLKPSSSYTIPLMSDSLSLGSNQSSRTQTCDNIEDRLRLIFARETTQPLIISAPDTEITQTQTLELLARATETLKREYVNKILRAKEELAAEAKVLGSKKSSQEALLRKLETNRTELRECAEHISEKYEDVRDRGQELAARVEAVLTKIQTRVPTASDAELKMARDVKALKNKMEQVQRATEQLKEKEKYQRYQLECVSGGVAPSSLSRHQVDNVKEVLQGDSLIITNLVKTLNHAKKDIAL